MSPWRWALALLAACTALAASPVASPGAAPVGVAEERPLAVAVESSVGLELASVLLRETDGSWVFRELRAGVLALGPGERFASLSAPGHVERDFDAGAERLVLEPSALFVLEGDLDCVKLIGPVACRIDGEPRPVRPTGRVLTFGRVGDRWLAAVARDSVDELRVVLGFGGSSETVLFRTEHGTGAFAVECASAPETAALEVELAREGPYAGGEVHLVARPLDGGGDSVRETPWGRVTRDASSRERHVAEGHTRFVFDALPTGRDYLLTAVRSRRPAADGSEPLREAHADGGAPAVLASVVLAHRDAARERLVLRPGLVVRGRVVDEGGTPLHGPADTSEPLREARVSVRLASASPGAPRGTRDAQESSPVEAEVDDEGRFRATLAALVPDDESTDAARGVRALAPQRVTVTADGPVRRVETRSSFVPPDMADVDAGTLVLRETDAHLVLAPLAERDLTGSSALVDDFDPASVEHVVLASAPDVLWKVHRALVRDGALELRLERLGDGRFAARPALGETKHVATALPDGEPEAVLVRGDVHLAFARDAAGELRPVPLAAYEVELVTEELPAQLAVAWRSMPLATVPEAEVGGSGAHVLRFVGPRAGLVLRWRGGGTHLRPGRQRIEL